MPMPPASRKYHCPVTALDICTVIFVMSGSSPPKSVEDAHEHRDDEGDQADQDAEGEGQHDGRVGHGRLDLAAQRVVLLELVGDAVERLLEHAAGLAGADHGHVQRGEDLGVLLERVGEGEARLDVLAHRADRLAQHRVLDLVLEHVERPQERHARGDHGRELARHDRELVLLDPLGAEPDVHLEAGLLLLERHDLEAAALELLDDGLLLVAVDGPGLRGCPARSTALKANVAIRRPSRTRRRSGRTGRACAAPRGWRSATRRSPW